MEKLPINKVGTNQIWDRRVWNKQVWDPQDPYFSSQLYHNFNDLALVLSTKESGYYSSLATATGMVIFPEENGGKPGLRINVDVGALRNAPGTQEVVHGLKFTRCIRIWGMASKSTVNKEQLPLPFISAVAADIINIYADKDKIYIIVGKDRSDYTANICIEFLET